MRGSIRVAGPASPDQVWERYAVPETGRIFYEAGFANFALHPPTDVHFERDDRAPLLIVGAEQDHTVPASVSRAQHKKYQRSSARTDYVEFEGRTAYGKQSRIPFHVTSLDWQESDRVLAGIMTTFGSPTGAIPISRPYMPT